MSSSSSGCLDDDVELAANWSSGSSSNSVLSITTRRKIEKRITGINTKALGTLAATFVTFTVLFVPVIGLRLALFECEVIRKFHDVHASLESVAFVATLLSFSLHPLLNVAADKLLKAEMLKLFRGLLSSKEQQRGRCSTALAPEKAAAVSSRCCEEDLPAAVHRHLHNHARQLPLLSNLRRISQQTV